MKFAPSALIALSIILSTPVSAYYSCKVYYIRHFARDNVAISINGGTVWEVYPKDRNKVWTWKEGDEVMMCYGHMVNRDREDQDVSIRYIGTYCGLTGRECFWNPYNKCCGRNMFYSKITL